MHILDRFLLTGKVAVVTGSSGGLGEGFALAMAAAGADLVLVGRRERELLRVRERITAAGGTAVAVAADVSDPAAAARIISAADTLGGVSILVNNAGQNYVAPAEDDDLQRFATVIQTNLFGAYQLSTACCRSLVSRGLPGVIINVTSVFGLTATEMPAAAYTASKSALTGLTRELAMQWTGRYGIRVNALAPGFIPTNMTADVAQGTPGYDIVRRRTPMRRFGALDELIGPLLLLASDAGSFMTGTTLVVDGGWTLH